MGVTVCHHHHTSCSCLMTLRPATCDPSGVAREWATRSTTTVQWRPVRCRMLAGPTLPVGPSRGRRVFKFSRARYWSSSRRSSPAARAPSPLLEMRGFSKTSLWLSSGCHWLTKWSSTIYFAGAKKSGVRDSTGILLILFTDSVSRWHG